MNVFSMVLLGISLYFLVTGALFGLKRGLIRSGLRLGMVIVSFAIAWYAKVKYVAAILDMKVDGVPLREAFTESMGIDASIIELILPLVEILLGVLLFVIVFFLLNFLTSIIFCAVGFLLPKGDRWFGLAVGLVQGALIAFCICAPLNGILLDVGTIAAIEVDGKPAIDAETQASMKEKNLDFESYAESGVSKFYTKLGSEFYNELASTENKEGRTLTLSGYVEAVTSTLKFTDEITKLTEVNFEGGLTAENRDTLEQTFKNLNEIKGDMSEEAVETVNDMITTVVSSVGGEVPENMKEILEDFDMSEVDFEKEGDAVLKLYDMTNAETEEKPSATEVVNTLAESSLALSVMENMVANETPVQLPDAATEAEVKTAIENLQLTNPEAAASLNKIFGWQNK